MRSLSFSLRVRLQLEKKKVWTGMCHFILQDLVRNPMYQIYIRTSRYRSVPVGVCTDTYIVLRRRFGYAAYVYIRARV